MKLDLTPKPSKPTEIFRWPWSEKALRGLSMVGFALLFALPFLAWNHAAPISTWQAEWFAAVAGVLACAVLLRSQAWATLRLTPILLSPVLLLAALGGQVVLGSLLGQMAPPVSTGAVWLLGLELVWALLLVLAAQALGRQMGLARLARLLAWALLLAGLLNAAVGLAQWATQFWHIRALMRIPALAQTGGFAAGLLAQRNLYADAQTLALFSLAYLAFMANSALAPGVKGLVSAAAALLVVSIGLSDSYAAVAYFVFGLLLALGMQVQQGRQARRLAQRAGLPLSAFALAALLLLLAVRFAVHLAGGPGHPGAGGILRILWGESLHLIAAHPWLGIGLGQTPQAMFHFAATLADTPQFSAFHTQGWGNVHNLVLQLGLEFGLPGLLAAAVLVWAALRAGLGVVRAMRQPVDGAPAGEQSQDEGAELAARVWALALLGVIGLHSLVEFPLWNLEFLGICAVLFGLSDSRGPSARRAFSVGPLAVGACLLVLAGVAVQAQLAMQAIRPLFATNTASTAFKAAVGNQIARQITIDRLTQDQSIAAQIVRPMVDLAQANSPLALLYPPSWPQRLASMQRLVQSQPSGTGPLQYAALLSICGHPAQAQREFDLALRATPNAVGAVLPLYQRLGQLGHGQMRAFAAQLQGRVR